VGIGRKAEKEREELGRVGLLDRLTAFEMN